jgi:hypothetical protein
MHVRTWAALAVVVGGCATTVPEVPADQDPSNAQAPESAVPPASTTLQAGPGADSSASAGEGSAPAVGGARAGHHHGHAAMPGAADDTMKGMSMPGMSMPGMSESPMNGQPDAGSAATVYACPMHPEVTSDKPGQCPKCHMQLRPQTSPPRSTP